MDLRDEALALFFNRKSKALTTRAINAFEYKSDQ